MSTNLITKAIHTVVKDVHLKNIKRIEIKFDPFTTTATSIRNFLFYISSSRVRQSNIKCSIKTSVVNDRSEPVAFVTVETGHKYLFKTGNLTTLEFVEEFYKLLKKHNPEQPLDDSLVHYKKLKAR